MYIKRLDKPGSLLKPPLSQKLKSGLVVLAPGEDVGEHVTDKREEIITVLDGLALVMVAGEEPTEVAAGHVVFIPAEKKHNIKNNGDGELKYVYTVALFN